MSGHCQSSDRNWATIGWETSRETETELWTTNSKSVATNKISKDRAALDWGKGRGI